MISDTVSSRVVGFWWQLVVAKVSSLWFEACLSSSSPPVCSALAGCSRPCCARDEELASPHSPHLTFTIILSLLSLVLQLAWMGLPLWS